MSRHKLGIPCLHMLNRGLLRSVNVIGDRGCLPWPYTCRLYSTQVELTSKRYPHMKRGNFAILDDQDVQFFERLLPNRILFGSDEVDAFNTDWLRTVRGNSQIVLKPKTTEEVSEILKYCNGRNLAVCPQGGNTGLVGGSVPVHDEVVLSTSLMDNVISIDDFSGTLVCQAGCILEKLDNQLAEHGLMMPLDLGAKGSCQIGGNISTNAGGLRLLRYGSLHGSVLGVEAVLANGDVIDCLSSLRKDNTGYDLKQLFIGSEGTLGVVTAASILCPRRPNAINVAFLGCQSFNQALEVFKKAKSSLAEILSAFEFMDHECMECVQDNLGLSNPLQKFPMYILIETSGSSSAHDEEKLTTFLESVMSEGLVDDGTVATDNTKIMNLWQLRERIAEGLLKDGYCYKYDISLPLDKIYAAVEAMRDRLGESVIRAVGYGHLGDGNLHFNTTSKEFSKEVKALIEPFIYQWTAKYKGSISAEHGMGIVKNNYMHYSKSQAAINLMKQMKNLMDPKGILNPYKTLPSSFSNT